MNDALEAQRPALFALAYRMLGGVADAEDVVQDAFIRYSTADARVETPAAYLRTVVVRLCLDKLKRASSRLERSATELPEPVSADRSSEATAQLAESLSIAFLRMLRSLTPLERAVFLLHEVFELDHAEIAKVVDRSEAACRQTLRRARQHVADGRPRFDTEEATARDLVERFAAAAQGVNVAALFELLAPGVVLTADAPAADSAPYGRARAIAKPIDGRKRVARFVAAVQGQAPIDLVYRIEPVNGAPGIVAFRGAQVVSVLAFRIDDGRIAEIFVYGDPSRLTQWC